MWAAIDFETELDKLKKYRPNITTKEILIKELQLELYNGILYADDDVLKTLKVFIPNLDYNSYLNVALAMRKDLYGKRSKIKFDDLKIEANEKAPPK